MIPGTDCRFKLTCVRLQIARLAKKVGDCAGVQGVCAQVHDNGDGSMSSILNNCDRANRAKLLKVSFSESEVARLHVQVFSTDITVIGVNWDDEKNSGNNNDVPL